MSSGRKGKGDSVTTRRQFLAGTGKAAAGLAAGSAAMGALTLSAASADRVVGANNRIHIAMIGCGGRGRFDTRGMMVAGAHLAWLCDLHPQRLKDAWSFLHSVQKEKPRFTKDMRDVLDDKDVDAVLVTTPDHWHGPATVRACQAGKDVYVEKPHAYCIWESHQMVCAARKYKRVVQVGTQNRSAPYNLAALEYVKSGRLGKIGLVKVFNMKSGGPFHLGSPGKQPQGFDWDRWLGRAPLRPYQQTIFYHGWHQFWDYSGGDMADDGIHQLDLAMMLMGDVGLPRSVRGLGGRYVWRGDDSEVPDVEVVNWDFGSFVMTFDLTEYPRYMEKTTGTIRRNDLLPYWTMNATRIEIYGSQLMMTVGRHGGGWIVQQSGGGVIKKMYGRVPDPYHYKNFLECVRSRKKPNADVGIADNANVAMHMGNIAHRVGNVSLNFDAKTRTFDNDKANELIKPPYRKGYAIPDQV